MAGILGIRRARTVYNLADAMLPDTLARADDGSRIDVLPALEQALRHEGLAPIRRTWLVLTVLDYWPIVAGPKRRRYWRLDSEARAQAAERFERLPLMGAGLREVLRRIEAAAVATRNHEGPAHSLEGA